MTKLTHISNADLNQIAIYMEDDLVEDILSISPNLSNIDFLNKYLQIDPSFMDMVNAVL